MAFKLFGAGKKKSAANPGPQTLTATTVMDDRAPKKKGAAPKLALPKFSLGGLFAQTGTGQKLKAGVAAFAVTVGALALLVVKDDRETKHGTDYIAIGGELRVLSQKIANPF